MTCSKGSGGSCCGEVDMVKGFQWQQGTCEGGKVGANSGHRYRSQVLELGQTSQTLTTSVNQEQGQDGTTIKDACEGFGRLVTKTKGIRRLLLDSDGFSCSFEGDWTRKSSDRTWTLLLVDRRCVCFGRTGDKGDKRGSGDRLERTDGNWGNTWFLGQALDLELL